MTDMTCREPAPATLRKYGLTREAWKRLLYAQRGVCAICERLPDSKRLVIDHEHVKKWKRKPPAERARYVRLLACNWCNFNHLRRGMTARLAANIARSLAEYESRKTDTTA